jgi:hypothetical protein
VLVVLVLVALAHLREPTFALAGWATAITLVVLPGPSRIGRAAFAIVTLAVVPYVLGFGVASFDVVGSSQTEIQQRRMWNAFGAATAILPSSGSERVVELEQELRRVQQEIEVAEEVVRSGSGAEGPLTTAAPEIVEAQARAARLHSREAELRSLLTDVYQVSPEEASESLAANVRHLPRGLSVMLVEPLPWQSTPTTQLKLAKVDTLTLYPLLALAAAGLLVARRHVRVLLFPVLLAAGVLVGYALTEGNFGTAYRHRAELGPTLVLLATLGIEQVVARRRGSVAGRVDSVASGR